MFRGDDQDFSITVVDANGQPVNLTGMKVWATFKYHINDLDSALAIQKTTNTSTITIAGSNNNVASFTIANADTASFSDTTVLYYDVQIKDGASKIHTIDSGTLTVNDDVTRATT